MSEEFKTLKDIMAEDVDMDKSQYDLVNYKREELKAEAVKRWKYYKKLTSKYYVKELYFGKMAELEEFFNLTEEDLKDE